MNTNKTSTPPAPAAGSESDEWRSMKTAPHNASWVDVKMPDGTVQRAHWASDLSGDDQPPFEGWFKNCGTYYGVIPDPVAWRPCPPPTTNQSGGGQ
jgi:hypothetical protein